MGIITLTTDYGNKDYSVSSLKAKLISEINKTELLLKKLPVNSINLVTNFLLEKSR